MKKLFILIAITLISASHIFAVEFTKADMAKKFFTHPTAYVKYINNDNDEIYVPNYMVISIQIGEKKITFRWGNKDVIGEDEWEESFAYDKWNVTGDDNGNITIVRKKK